MKKSLVYTVVFSAMMMVTGCGGGNDNSNTTKNSSEQSINKRTLTYTTNARGDYYLDFSEMNNETQIIIQADSKFYTHNKARKEGFSGDYEGIKTYYNEKSLVQFEYLENGVVKADFFDRKSGFVKRVFSIIKEGELYTQETTNPDIVNIDESKPLVLHSGVNAEVDKILSAADPLKITSSPLSASARSINFSFFPTAHAEEYAIQKSASSRNNKTGIVFGTIMMAFAAGELAVVGSTAAVFATLPVALPVAIGVLGAIVLYENSSKFRDFMEAPVDNLKKGSVNLITNLIDVLIPNANASEEEIKYWKKLLDEENKKCKASGLTLINGVCKKEEEPQCLADEVLVNGICKKKEPICSVDEILVDGICKKKDPVCATGETLVNGVCKKPEPICATDEILENGKCIKKPVTATSFTKIGATGKKLADSATEWDCVLDNETGLMWEKKTQSGGFRDMSYSYSWFEDDTGFYDPRDIYTEKYGYKTIPNYAKPYGFYCNNTLTKCNTKAYTQAINNQKLCGVSDWRLPSKNELVQLSKRQEKESFLENAIYGSFYSSSLYIDQFNASFAWSVFLLNGSSIAQSKNSPSSIMAVRNTK